MWTHSYTSLQIIHDEKIARALEQARASRKESAPRTRSLVQAIGAWLTRLRSAHHVESHASC